MKRSWPISLLVVPIELLAICRAVSNAPCSLLDTRLEPGSYQLVSDCELGLEYCAQNSTCQPIQCRRSDYPYGFLPGMPQSELPPKCPTGLFCPDEMDRCLPQQPAGAPCQMNRDDECQPPPSNLGLNGGRNTKGAICLNFACYWANATLNESCFLDNNVFTGYLQNGTQFPFIISRDNCANGLYCDGSSRICLEQSSSGISCTSNKQCISQYCSQQGICQPAIDKLHMQPWYFAIIILICISLVLFLLLGLAIRVLEWRIKRQEKAEFLFWQSIKQK